jgi:SSS family solute:Na+ symporter
MVLRMDILIPVVVYYLVVTVGIGTYYIRKYGRASREFTVAAMMMSWWLVATGIVLGPFGAGHTLSPAEATWAWGATPNWWSIAGGTLSLTIILFTIARWYRRLGVITIPEAFGKLFSPSVRAATAATILGANLAICSLEFYASAAAISGFTGLDIEYCIAIAFVLIIVYVLFSGVMQLAAVNLVNLIVYYLGVAFSLVVLSSVVGQVGGWKAVEQAIVQRVGVKGITLFAPEPGPFLGLVIPIAILHLCYVSLVQGFLQPALAAKEESQIVKGWPLVMVLNASATTAFVVIGLSALALPSGVYGPAASLIESFRAQGAAVPAIILTITDVLPGAGALILMSLLAATLSTAAAFILGTSTIIVEDLISSYTTLSERAKLILLRAFIVITCIICLIGAYFKPYLMAAFLWMFAWTVPFFVGLVLGWVWRRNDKAMLATIAVTWIVHVLWTLLGVNVPISWLQPPLGNTYPLIIIAIVVYVVLATTLKGGKEPGKMLVK